MSGANEGQLDVLVSREECEHMFFYYPSAPNENGWKCCRCEEKGGDDGYSPELDRSHTYLKVGGILNDLHSHKFVYVSNGSEGDFVTSAVTDRCRAKDVYDQASIIHWLIEAIGLNRHQEFWKKRSAEKLAANTDVNATKERSV